MLTSGFKLAQKLQNALCNVGINSHATQVKELDERVYGLMCQVAALALLHVDSLAITRMIMADRL